MLVDAGVDVRVTKRNTGENALHTAHTASAASEFLRIAPDLRDSQDFRHATPLHVACVQENAEVAAVLLRAGAQPNVRTYNGETPLGLAVINSKKKSTLVKVLLENGADPKILGTYVHSVLYLAIDSPVVDIVKELLEHGAMDGLREGEVPLAIAVKSRNLAVASLLIQHGANPKARGLIFDAVER